MKPVDWKSQSGQALVEMAIILPILLVLLLGIISYGLYINAVDTVQQATRLGVRAATIGSSLGCPGDSAQTQLSHGKSVTVYGIVDDQLKANRWLAGSVPSTPITYAVVIGNQSDFQDNEVLLTVRVPYHPVVPIPKLLPSTVEITDTYEMLVQNSQASNAITTSEPTGPPYYETAQWTSPPPPSSNVTWLIQPGGC